MDVGSRRPPPPGQSAVRYSVTRKIIQVIE
jgi:hypothetical protein